MKKLILLTALTTSITFTSFAYAEDTSNHNYSYAGISVGSPSSKDTKCDNSSSCVSSKYFTANIERISKRGKVVIIQIKYLSKINTFDVDFKDGYVLLLDSNGNEFKVAGNSVSKFKIRRGSFRVLSFRFKGSDKTPIISPFDLTIKASDEHGEITFFDLEPLKKK